MGVQPQMDPRPPKDLKCQFQALWGSRQVRSMRERCGMALRVLTVGPGA